MAQDLSKVAPVLISQGLMALRSYNVMPRLVNSDYQGEAVQKNATINVPIPSAVATTDVVPGPTAPQAGDSTPTDVPIVLDQWKEAAFYLTDKDLMQSMEGTIPMQASEAVKSLADTVNAYLLGFYKEFYGFVGTPGTTPFASDVSAAALGRKVLNAQLCPKGDRRFVIDLDAEANALQLPLFQQANTAGTNRAQVEGEIDRKMGMDWYSDQQMPTHIAGTQTGATVAKASTAQAIGDKDIIVTTAATTGALNLVKGDIITFAGDVQTYVVTAAVTAGAGVDATINIYPGLKKALAGSEALSIKGNHVPNMIFHRDAITFATRPLAQVSHPSVIMSQASDPVSGLSMRLQITREYQRTRFAYDMLFGGQVIRKEFGTRVAG